MLAVPVTMEQLASNTFTPSHSSASAPKISSANSAIKVFFHVTTNKQSATAIDVCVNIIVDVVCAAELNIQLPIKASVSVM